MSLTGIRQGRLSGRISGQEFPWHTWKDEFTHARGCGFATIEWLFAAAGHERNPIWTDDGPDEIRRLAADSGIEVRSLCADYFLAHPLFRIPDGARQHNISILIRLIAQSARAGVRTIVLPVLEAAGLRTAADKAQLVESLAEPLAIALERGVRLAIETDLPSADCRMLVERAAHPALGICYDTGNAAARGFGVSAGMRGLWPHVCEVHIKDRTGNDGPNVPLGHGAVDFADFFRTTAEIGYTGLFVLETPAADRAGAAAQLAFLARQR